MSTPKPASAPPAFSSPLLRYGRHDAECAMCHDSMHKPRPVCTCGFDEALAASAPPADALSAIVAQMREMERMLPPHGAVHIVSVARWADRIEALAASAQVREVEPLQAALNFWLPAMGQVDAKWSERIGDDAMLLMGFTGKGVDEPTYWGAEQHGQVNSHGQVSSADKPAAEPVPATINSSEIDSNLIGEPVPVAQLFSERHGEALRSLADKFRSGNNIPVERATILHSEWEAICAFVRDQESIITGHARRESEAVERELRMSFKAQALEASLAACRADAERYRVARGFLSVSVIEGRAANVSERHGDYLARVDAAVDALRQDAP